jgi:hypothetical protein
MTSTKWFGVCAAIAGLAVMAVRVHASDPVGVYAVVDKVVFEPNEANPTAVQIWGAFSLAVPRSSDGAQRKPEGGFGSLTNGDVYGAVQKGYLYFTCPTGKETMCRNEWTDLKSLAGKHQIAGFGTRWGSHVTVRQATERPSAPDQYVPNVGVVKLGSYSANPELAAALDAASRAK